MALRGPRPTLLLALVLLASCLALASGQAWVELNKIFQRHHENYPRTQFQPPSSYCNRMMVARGLHRTRVNTFIHARSTDIKNICLNGINLLGNLYRSKQQFNITICRYNPQTRLYTTSVASRMIVIGCWKKFPVYYKE